MKNKKIYTTMLILTITFLLAMYILKIFFPQEFVMAIQNERIVAIGNFIDSHIWLRYLCEGLMAFITYTLYCCACTHRLRLKWYEYLYVIATIVGIRLISLYDNNISTAIQFGSFIFLPAIMKGNLQTTAIVATTHYIAQCLMLSIRNLPMYLTTMNYVTVLFMTIECYLWLTLFYIIFNYKKESKK